MLWRVITALKLSRQAIVFGGHARTRMAGPQRTRRRYRIYRVHHANYPHLTALFDHLSVPVVKSNMSFGASLMASFEHALTTLMRCSHSGAMWRTLFSAHDPRRVLNKHGLAARPTRT
jgi:predicted NAD/FAD-binding protein